jgi:hypothetical protein
MLENADKLPVTGTEQADKVIDVSGPPSNELIKRGLTC